MEKKWPRGVDTEGDYTRAWLEAGKRGFVVDKYYRVSLLALRAHTIVAARPWAAGLV